MKLQNSLNKTREKLCFGFVKTESHFNPCWPRTYKDPSSPSHTWPGQKTWVKLCFLYSLDIYSLPDEDLLLCRPAICSDDVPLVYWKESFSFLESHLFNSYFLNYWRHSESPYLCLQPRYKKSQKIKYYTLEAEDIAHRLRALPAFAEDRVVLSTDMMAHSCLQLQFQGVPHILLASQCSLCVHHAHTFMQAYTRTHKSNKFKTAH